MHTPQLAARPRFPATEARLKPGFLRFIRVILKPAARLARFNDPVILGSERLVAAFSDFHAGSSRLIVGFRHAYGDDAQLAGLGIHRALPKAARRLGRPFRALTHLTFVYGMEVPLWSNGFVRWLLPSIGAIPVDHTRADAVGMNRIRNEIANGRYPVALAPEGHVTYASETVAAIEPGAVRFGFWCMEDLERSERTEKTVFIPLSFHYRYNKSSIRRLNRLVIRMEKTCGIPGPGKLSLSKRSGNRPGEKNDESGTITVRLDAVANAIKKNLARSYSLPDDSSQEAILAAALSACERALGMDEGHAASDPVERFYRMRSVGWDRLFRDDLEGMTELERNIADRLAGEAWFAMRHMEISELLIHVALSPSPSVESLGLIFERAINLNDFIGRIGGGTLRHRSNPALKTPIIVAGEPIVFNEYLPLYRESKKNAIRTVTDLVKDRFDECVKEYRHEYENA